MNRLNYTKPIRILLLRLGQQGNRYGKETITYERTLLVSVRHDLTLKYKLYKGWQDDGPIACTIDLGLPESLPSTYFDKQTLDVLKEIQALIEATDYSITKCIVLNNIIMQDLDRDFRLSRQ